MHEPEFIPAAAGYRIADALTCGIDTVMGWGGQYLSPDFEVPRFAAVRRVVAATGLDFSIWVYVITSSRSLMGYPHPRSCRAFPVAGIDHCPDDRVYPMTITRRPWEPDTDLMYEFEVPTTITVRDLPLAIDAGITAARDHERSHQ